MTRCGAGTGSVKLSEMKLGLRVSDHVTKSHKTRESLGHAGTETFIKKTSR